MLLSGGPVCSGTSGYLRVKDHRLIRPYQRDDYFTVRTIEDYVTSFNFFSGDYVTVERSSQLCTNELRMCMDVLE